MKTKVLYFYAMWDNHATEKLNNFYKAVKALKVPFDVIDVETPEGVKASIKYEVRNVPTILYVNPKNGKEIDRDKGNTAYERIQYHF